MRPAWTDTSRPATSWAPVHFVGIGGAGMSGIARIMLARGVAVSGQRREGLRALPALRAAGRARRTSATTPRTSPAPTPSWSRRRSGETNPELVAARERRPAGAAPGRGARRAHGRATRSSRWPGTHGKTTTTSMLTVALQHCGVDPSFAIGGDLNESGANAHHGSGDVFVAEADESDGSFLLYRPHVAIVTNVEPDHLDHYGDAGGRRATPSTRFAGSIDAGGSLVACADDPGSAAAGRRRARRRHRRAHLRRSRRRRRPAASTCVARPARRPASTPCSDGGRRRPGLAARACPAGTTR